MGFKLGILRQEPPEAARSARDGTETPLQLRIAAIVQQVKAVSADGQQGR